MVVNRLCLRASAAAGREIASFVCGLADQVGLTAAQVYRLRLAADEIVTNITLHGYRGKPGPVELVGGIEPDRVWLCIVDEGPPFDPTTHDPKPRLAEPTVGPEGGFGQFLALSGVDDFAYDRKGGQNRNTLIMRRP